MASDLTKHDIRQLLAIGKRSEHSIPKTVQKTTRRHKRSSHVFRAVHSMEAAQLAQANALL